MMFSKSSVSLAMLNILTNKQASNILDELGIDRNQYPIEWTAKRIVRDLLLGPGIKSSLFKR